MNKFLESIIKNEPNAFLAEHTDISKITGISEKQIIDKIRHLMMVYPEFQTKPYFAYYEKNAANHILEDVCFIYNEGMIVLANKLKSEKLILELENKMMVRADLLGLVESRRINVDNEFNVTDLLFKTCVEIFPRFGIKDKITMDGDELIIIDDKLVVIVFETLDRYSYHGKKKIKEVREKYPNYTVLNINTDKGDIGKYVYNVFSCVYKLSK